MKWEGKDTIHRTIPIPANYIIDRVKLTTDNRIILTAKRRKYDFKGGYEKEES